MAADQLSVTLDVIHQLQKQKQTSILSKYGSTKPINDADSSDQIQIFHQCPYYGNWLEISIVYKFPELHLGVAGMNVV